MKWIFDHIQLIIAAAGAIAWWLGQRKQAAAGEEEPPAPEATFDDPDLAARTRKIREEIQRKIEQRARGYTEPPPVVQLEPPPLARETPPARAASRIETQRQAEILEEQAAMMERLREAEFMKAAAGKRTEFETSTADHQAEVLAATRGTVLDDLRTPAALRRAFILREVLGPPVALRP